MPADAIQLGELRVRADARDTFSQLALLLGREQDIGAYTDDERALELQPFET